MTNLRLFDYQPDDLDVQIADLIVATPDAADPLTHPKVAQALTLMRERLAMDVVFVSQFADGRRTFRMVDDARATPHKIRVGACDPLEDSWCQLVAQDRVPGFIQDATPYIAGGVVPDPGIPIGTHMSTPITLSNGEVYGTLCCFSCEASRWAQADDLRRLKLAAKLIAAKLAESGVGAELRLSDTGPQSADGAARSRAMRSSRPVHAGLSGANLARM